MYADRWDLDCFFQGGSASVRLQKEMEHIQAEILSLGLLLQPETFLILMEKMQDIDVALRECDAFILCLQSQDTSDKRADQLRAEFTGLESKFQLFGNQLDDFFVHMDNSSFQSLISDASLADIKYVLEERRTRGQQKLHSEEENLITRLSVDGYHSWGDLYSILVGEIKIPFKEKGKQEILSFGQAENKLVHPDRRIREEVFTDLEKAWDGKASLFASVLNHIGGFRLEVYARRGWVIR